MSSSRDYDGQDQFFIGDESSLPITETSSISLNLAPYLFNLQNVLSVPDATKKLIFVS